MQMISCIVMMKKLTHAHTKTQSVAHKHTVTNQVSRTSCDKDTIESVEKGQKALCSRFTFMGLSRTHEHRQLGCQTITSTSFL